MTAHFCTEHVADVRPLRAAVTVTDAAACGGRVYVNALLDSDAFVGTDTDVGFSVPWLGLRDSVIEIGAVWGAGLP